MAELDDAGVPFIDTAIDPKLDTTSGDTFTAARASVRRARASLTIRDDYHVRRA
jgi:uncharacterized SAM-binding protein YcdF (DUF218 family)